MRFTTGLTWALAGFASLLLVSAASAGGPETLAAYRGVYDLQLETTSEKAAINTLAGRMVYEFNGSKCEGYTTQFRFITRIDMKEAPTRMTDQQTTTFESPDGKHFRFASKNFVDQQLTKEVIGAAVRDGKGITVKLTKPEDAEYAINPAVFPISHTLQVIKNALDGKRFFRIRLYDASEDADETTETTVIIGRQQKPQPDRETRIMGAYGNEPVWPVTISYFSDRDNRDGLPAYRTSFLMYKNGITRDLVMDYGDFSIRGKLVHFDILDRKPETASCAR